MIPRRVLLLLLTILLSGLHALPASAADQVGVVRVIRGEVQAQVPGEALRQLQRGDAIFEGDHISTGDSARIAMRFNDNSRMDLGPGTETVIEEFANADSGRAPGFTTRILRGAFRFVSGLIGKRRPRSVRVRVPVATIGIRGTHFAGEVDGTYARVVLLEPEEDDELTAIEVSNQFGSVVIDQPNFGTEIPDDQSPPSPVRRMQLRTVQDMLRSIRSIQRVNPGRMGIRR
ncbi:MAG: FecR domain-containing protein [Gammaproteobacteria bacterium]|nr:FecR domain-containing protein [Gammaproteobacteria bacterium]